MIPDVIAPTEVSVNRFVTATYSDRRGVALMAWGEDPMLPNYVVEFNTQDCVRCVLFAYVDINYPAGVRVDYTALMEAIGYAITNDLESREYTVELPVPMVMLIRSVLGEPYAHKTDFKGLLLQVMPDIVFKPVSVFNEQALATLMGDRLPTHCRQVQAQHLDVAQVEGRILVTYDPPEENADEWIPTGLYPIEQGADDAALHDPSSEVAPS